ncbi:hypothetical protein ACFFHF_14510 [Robertmurraya beringensis]|uniref:Uncharacterized protein n=1 Tax=Robertmurraya beringensis TaxID=641660 RepID=A0ABV6KSW1_9BACI
MANKITSGPFFVPPSIDTTASGAVRYLFVGFKNLANTTSSVLLTVHKCNDLLLYPPNTPEEIEFYRQRVTIPPGDCAVVRIEAGPTTFSGNNMLRVAIAGDTDEEADGIVVTLSGTTVDGRQVLSMVFKHEDFVELDD